MQLNSSLPGMNLGGKILLRLMMLLHLAGEVVAIDLHQLRLGHTHPHQGSDEDWPAALPVLLR